MKTQANPPKLMTSPMSQGDSLLVFMFFAALLHLFIVLGISFTTPPAPKPNRSLDITLSHVPSNRAPFNAKFLAQDNQQGGGELEQKPQLAQHNIPVPVDAAPEPVAEKTPQPRQEQLPVKPNTSKVLTREKSETKAPTAELESDRKTEEASAEQAKPHLSPELLQQQIAQLGEQIREIQSSENSKIKYVNAVSTQKYLASQYVKDWESKVERTGNLNYPEAARHRGQSQMLTMDVAINGDGSIYSMRITRSSGNPALDDAAKQIVKMSAPFAPLPNELLKELNVLVITRVWKFSDETGMTAR